MPCGLRGSASRRLCRGASCDAKTVPTPWDAAQSGWISGAKRKEAANRQSV